MEVKLGLSYIKRGIHWEMIEERVLRKICGHKKRITKNVSSLYSYNE
jgi:hypothetical protein